MPPVAAAAAVQIHAQPAAAAAEFGETTCFGEQVCARSLECARWEKEDA